MCLNVGDLEGDGLISEEAVLFYSSSVYEMRRSAKIKPGWSSF